MICFDPDEFEITNYRMILNENPQDFMERVQRSITEDGMLPLGGVVSHGDSLMQTLISIRKKPKPFTGPR